MRLNAGENFTVAFTPLMRVKAGPFTLCMQVIYIKNHVFPVIRPWAMAKATLWSMEHFLYHNKKNMLRVSPRPDQWLPHQTGKVA